MFTFIVAVIVAGSILAIFGESLPQGRFWTMLKKALLFIPYLVLGIILHVARDFKNNRLGYAVIFLVVGMVVFGMYMGYKAGPSIPATWDN